MRFGFFGGSFDPVHNSHLALAQAALQELHLDRVYFVPAFRPPHKSDRVLTDARHRVAMLRAACSDRKGCRVSLWEIRQKGISYTERSLRAFKRLHTPAEWHLLIGGDSLASFKKWKNWRWLLDNSRIVVGERKGVPKKAISRDLKPWVVFLKKRLPKISSTEIRRKASKGLSLRGLVPPAVEKYIRRNGLYRD